jgi:Tfp pilus assembly PilM family ATPase/Tfp pilus assembly protein PilN
MYSLGKSSPQRHVIVEVSRDHLTLSILDRRFGASPELRSFRSTWEESAISGANTLDRATVAAKLKALLGDEKVAGLPARLVLSGDFCVTRTVAGTREQVERELHALRDRCSLYISLGQGPKAFAENVRTIDAKRAQGSMTITNQTALVAVTDAVREIGLKVTSIEHSLVALSRAVGKTGRDAELPVIVVELHQHGIDLGISFQGHLLLDYRPGGLSRQPGEQRQLAGIIQKHLGRIRRYCHRYFQYSGGKLAHVVLSGHGEEVEALQQHFNEESDLQATILPPHDVCPDWKYDGDAGDDACLLPTLGALLHEQGATSAHASPDLLKPLLLSQREPLGPALRRRAWPMAAALLLALVAYGGGFYQSWRANELTEAVAKARQDAEILASKQVELRSVENKMAGLTVIAKALPPTRWDFLLAEVSGCLPQGAWLESLKVDRAGTLYLYGPSFNENGVYELVEQLKQVPELSEVVLEGTRPARLESGPATLFDVKCNLHGRSDRKEGA